MEALSAFPESCLEEFMLTVLILSNLATVSGYPLGQKKKEWGQHTKLGSFACEEMSSSFQRKSAVWNILCFSLWYFESSEVAQW